MPKRTRLTKLRGVPKSEKYYQYLISGVLSSGVLDATIRGGLLGAKDEAKDYKRRGYADVQIHKEVHSVKRTRVV